MRRQIFVVKEDGAITRIVNSSEDYLAYKKMGEVFEVGDALVQYYESRKVPLKDWKIVPELVDRQRIDNVKDNVWAFPKSVKYVAVLNLILSVLLIGYLALEKLIILD